MNSESENKYQRLCQLLDEEKFNAIVLRREHNIACLIGGHTPILSTSPIAAGILATPTQTVIERATSAAGRINPLGIGDEEITFANSIASDLARWARDLGVVAR